MELRRHVTSCLNLTKQPERDEEASITLPALLSPVVWRKHGYSLDDVEKTLEKLPVTHLWTLALAEGLTAKHKRLGHTAPSCREKLLSHFAEIDWIQTNHANTKLLTADKQHVPPIPSHGVDKNLFDEISRHCCEGDRLTFTHVFTDGQGSDYIPLRTEHHELDGDGASMDIATDMVLLMRVCSLGVFRVMFSGGVLEEMATIWLNGRALMLLEEAFLVYVRV
jgi:hypothetical protein